jgi:hypothetical protein
VARSLERTWEEKLRVAQAVEQEQEHARWRAREPLLIGPRNALDYKESLRRKRPQRSAASKAAP